MGKDKSRKGSFIRRVSSSLDLPYDGVAGSFRIEVRGDAEMLISGCEGVLQYEKERIKLRLKGKDALIFGEQLECLTYLEGTVEIKGRIAELKFLAVGGGENDA